MIIRPVLIGKRARSKIDPWRLQWLYNKGRVPAGFVELLANAKSRRKSRTMRNRPVSVGQGTVDRTGFSVSSGSLLAASGTLRVAHRCTNLCKVPVWRFGREADERLRDDR